jgi:cytochrome c
MTVSRNALLRPRAHRPSRLRHAARLTLAALILATLALAELARAAEAGAANWDTQLPPESRFEITVLTRDCANPMEMSIASDGRVFFCEKFGSIKVYKPTTRETVLVAKLDTYAIENGEKGNTEDGLIGLTLDPDFDTNHWLYVLRAAPGEAPEQHLSRFTVNGDKLDLASEKILLVNHNCRTIVGHCGGCLSFCKGDLYISCGDNTTPFESDGFSPLDPRTEGRDARATASNTMDFRGKILRIHPKPDGTYDIPPGNLFPPGTAKTRPEIYIMGCRNPFRHFADPVTGCLYWGEVGPDAGKDGDRGPRGYDEFNRATGPGYYGWPLFVGDNQAYAEYDWDTKKIGKRFDPAKPINDSPRNTGITELPPAQPAWMWYPYAVSDKFPDFGNGGRCAMAGPVYHQDPRQTSPNRFPGYYDNTLFIYEWMRSWIKAVKLDAKGEMISMEPFLPATKLRHAMDMRFGPEGALYVIEFGNNWWHPDQADIVRIDFVPGNRAPVAKASADVTVGKQPLTVHFSSEGTYDKDEGDALTYAWSFTGKGVDSTEAKPSFTFAAPGTYQATLTVTDKGGKTAIAVVPIRVGNAMPKVMITAPINGHFFKWGETVAYKAQVSDEEDGSTEAGTIPANKVKFSIGYESEREDATPGEEQGLSTGANQRGKNRVMKSDCIACHQVSVQSVGPAFTAVATKYHGVAGILDKLTDKVITGGGGVWGPIAMAAHPQFTRDEIQEMVAWVLSLAEDQGAVAGAAGSFTTMAKPAKDDRGEYVLVASYTDRGAPGAEPLTASARIALRSRVVNAADHGANKGTMDEPSADLGAGKHVTNIDPGCWLSYKAITLDGTSKVTYRVASGGAGGVIEMHADSATGPLLGSIAIEPTGGWQKWVDVEGTVTDPGGTHDLVLVFTNADKKKKKLLNLHWIYFHPAGE